MPQKPSNDADLETYMEYGKKIITYIQTEEKLQGNVALQERTRYVEEIIEDNLKDLKLSIEPDAKVGTFPTKSFKFLDVLFAILTSTITKT